MPTHDDRWWTARVYDITYDLVLTFYDEERDLEEETGVILFANEYEKTIKDLTDLIDQSLREGLSDFRPPFSWTINKIKDTKEILEDEKIQVDNITFAIKVDTRENKDIGCPVSCPEGASSLADDIIDEFINALERISLEEDFYPIFWEEIPISRDINYQVEEWADYYEEWLEDLQKGEHGW